jgi:hypothetical protein
VKLPHVALVLLLPAALAAQTPHQRLTGRVPALALPAIDSLIGQAVAESLPTEPLVQKALEGSAKNIPPERLVSGVRRGLLQLRDARAILTRALPVAKQPVPEGHVAAVAAALARGVDRAIVERLVAVAPADPPGPALHAEADLVAHRFDPDSAASLLVAARERGLRGERLLDVALAASHELQRDGGRTPGEALARVRAMLPNVPAAPAEHAGAVTRRGARRS